MYPKWRYPKRPIAAKTAGHVQFMIIWVVSKPMVTWDFPSNCLILICRHCQAMFEDCCGVALGCSINSILAISLKKSPHNPTCLTPTHRFQPKKKSINPPESAALFDHFPPSFFGSPDANRCFFVSVFGTLCGCGAFSPSPGVVVRSLKKCWRKNNVKRLLSELKVGGWVLF